MGWTGLTRQLMWTGQQYRPVRVKMTSLCITQSIPLLLTYHTLFLKAEYFYSLPLSLCIATYACAILITLRAP